ncbi:MAG: formylglycine-generating enzyme family protein [Gammaproteobacteria bacterium]
MRKLLFLIAAILLPQTLVANNAFAGFDVVTMRNGDIHQGTVAEEYITIETSIGVQKVPYHLLQDLVSAIHQEPDKLTTKRGEMFVGQIRNADISVLRVLDTALPLELKDIANIHFSDRGIPILAITDQAALETVDGMYFLANLATDDFLFRSETSMKVLDRSDLQSIDLMKDEDSGLQAQLRLKNGEVYTGTLLTEKFALTLHYSESIDVPITTIASLVLSPAILHGKADFLHRWQQAPANLIQDTMVNGDLATELIAIEAGSFVRGDAEGDTDEQPPVNITLAGFAIGVFEVTFQEYDRFCKDTHKECPDDAGWGRGNRPVFNVSWNDAIAYTDWLSRKTRKSYRLPTDAEWEYAARAGSQQTFWWGDEPGLANANCEGCGSAWDGAMTAAAGRFPANPFGLYDTAGNVFEWVADCWHDSFAEAPANGAALEKPGCGKRVIRGGAWSFPPKEIRSANRWRDFPSRRSDDTGFRVARDL